MQKILILGGVKMARQLAERLANKHQITYSIAGSTQAAVLPKNCKINRGGFGGAAGLFDYLNTNQFDICIDATHPFAINISKNAIAACHQANMPIIQFARKAWEVKGAQEFTDQDNLIKALPKNAVIFLTIGSKNIIPFLQLKQPILARMIEQPNLANNKLPSNFKISLSRPPYKLEDEMNLMEQNKITHLVCKNSGGHKKAAKIHAAIKQGIAIFMLSQPSSPHKLQFFTAKEVEDYLYNLSLSSPS